MSEQHEQQNIMQLPTHILDSLTSPHTQLSCLPLSTCNCNTVCVCACRSVQHSAPRYKMRIEKLAASHQSAQQATDISQAFVNDKRDVAYGHIIFLVRNRDNDGCELKRFCLGKK